MTPAWAERRFGGSGDPGSGALLFFSLVAAAGFAFGWISQALSALA
jgi:hypothetical protein